MGVNLLDLPVILPGDPLRDGLVLLCERLGRPTSPAELGDGLALVQGRLPLSLVPRALRRIEVSGKVAALPIDAMESYLLPALLLLTDGRSVVLVAQDGVQAEILVPDSGGGAETVALTDLTLRYAGFAVFAKPRYRSDARGETFIPTTGEHWFFGTLKRYRSAYLEVALAAMMANLLATGSALFAMQVYDRVVPNAAFDTLWILASGVALAIVLETMLRVIRAHLLDIMGKRLDLRLSTQLFERVLATRLAAKPPSLGAFSTQIREFESVREFFTSASAAAISDLPFVFIFLAIIAIIGGNVVWVPVAAILLILLPGILAQKSLARLSRKNLREGAVKNAILLESIEHLETVKASRAEGRALHQWETLTAELASTANQTSRLSASLSYSAAMIQQIGYAGVVVMGVYQISAGQMTMGALIACSILASRGIAPMSQAAGILARWQHIKVALAGLDQLMSAPMERPAGIRFVRKERLTGDYRVEDLVLRYGDGPAVVNVAALAIAPCERVALLGGNGAGKSSLLRILSGLGDQTSGRIFLDNVALNAIDPADRRRAIGFLPQDVALLHGTLRENLNLSGSPVSDEEMLEALENVDLGPFVRGHPHGLDMSIASSGSLSGGQRQAIGLSRILLQDPSIVLLDEPTAAFDQIAERHIIDYLRDWLQGRTLIVTTHKKSLLDIVDRAVVLQDGRVIVDGPLNSVVAGNVVHVPKEGEGKEGHAH